MTTTIRPVGQRMMQVRKVPFHRRPLPHPRRVLLALTRHREVQTRVVGQCQRQERTPRRPRARPTQRADRRVERPLLVAVRPSAQTHRRTTPGQAVVLTRVTLHRDPALAQRRRPVRRPRLNRVDRGVRRMPRHDRIDPQLADPTVESGSVVRGSPASRLVCGAATLPARGRGCDREGRAEPGGSPGRAEPDSGCGQPDVLRLGSPMDRAARDATTVGGDGYRAWGRRNEPLCRTYDAVSLSRAGS